MNLNYIKEFVVLTQFGKFQETADALYLSQSSLSKHIMSLEKELDHDLLTRSSRQKQQLTSFGKAFLPYALQLCNIYDEMEQNLLKPSSKSGNHLVIGSSPVVPLYSVFSFLDSFFKENPDFKTEVIDAPQQDLFDMLRNGRCNVIIVQESPLSESRDFQNIPYTQDYLATLLPADHPLAKCKSLSKDDIQHEKFIQISDGIHDDVLKINNAIIVSRPSAVIDLVKNHIGISMMSKRPAIHYSNGQLAVVDIEPSILINYQLVYMKSKHLPPVVEELINYVSQKNKNYSE